MWLAIVVENPIRSPNGLSVVFRPISGLLVIGANEEVPSEELPAGPDEFEARLADEPACPDLPVPTALAGGFDVPIIRGI